MSSTHRTITEIWRTESAKVVAVLTRIVRDVDLAEELAQDALVAALEEWPRSGIPDRPAAWLMTTAKNRALNTLHRQKMLARKHADLGRELDALADVEDALLARMDDVRDDVLRLLFIACHPVLSTEARVALTLRLVGGLATDEIARAFLVPEPTVAQRIVRAKRTIAEEKLAFEMPETEALGERLRSVLEVVYLVFNEGYAATAGEDLVRADLVSEALRLGRLLAELAPAEREVHGLVALMELQASRLATRVDASGEPVLLADQDRSRWDALAIRRGLAALSSAEAAGAGYYALQAEIAACHARATTFVETDWKRIASLYEALADIAPSPVIALNHAVAVSRADGPAAGLALLDALANEPALARYHLFPSARADLLEQLGRRDEARGEFARAAAMTDNGKQRARLMARARG